MRRLILATLTAQQFAATAFAQDVPPDEADDAFGRRVGVESIDLYGEGQVRGFNLENAGNHRIEGHYFARAASPQYIVRDATITRIGVNAFRYDFPAPSNVVEFDLPRTETGETLRVEAGTRDHFGLFADILGSRSIPVGRRPETKDSIP